MAASAISFRETRAHAIGYDGAMTMCPLCETEPPAAFDRLCTGCRARQQRGELRAVGLAIVFFVGTPVLAWLLVG